MLSKSIWHENVYVTHLSSQQENWGGEKKDKEKLL